MKLSFCIPTYNHARFLGAALDSILSQAPPDFEIVIVDGASKDNTAEVVAGYQLRTSAIRYRRMTENRGIDPDIAECVEMATGEYCWLMSSDDVVPDGAVKLVTDTLASGRSLYLGSRLVCTKDMVAFGADGVFEGKGRRSWDFSSQAELLDYLRSASGLIALFSYISVLVFRRDIWFSERRPDFGMGSCYAHAFRLWSALSRSGQVEFLGAPVVMCRMDTDNFASRGVYRRFMLDFDGYLGIADRVFDQRPEVRQAFLGAVQREHGIFRLAKFFHACVHSGQRQVALDRLRSIGYPSGRLLAMRLVTVTGPLVDVAVAFRRVLKRFVGSARLQS